MSKAKPFPVKEAAKGRSLSEFREAHDKNTIVPAKIRKGLAKLGKSSWEYEADFVKRCGLSQTDVARFRDQFAEYWFDLTTPRKRIWAGSSAFADELKNTIQ